MNYPKEVELSLYMFDYRFQVDFIWPLLLDDPKWGMICRGADRMLRETGSLDEHMAGLIWSRFEPFFLDRDAGWQLGD